MAVARPFSSSTLSCEAVAIPFSEASRVDSISPSNISFNSSGRASIPAWKLFTYPFNLAANSTILSLTAPKPANVPSLLNHLSLYSLKRSPRGSSSNFWTSICLTILATISSTFSPHASAASSPALKASIKASPNSFAMSVELPPIMLSTSSFIIAPASAPSSCICRSQSAIFP